jgi:uncharacterized protein (TIGR03067 family)
MKVVSPLALCLLWASAGRLDAQTPEIQKEVDTLLERLRLEGTWSPKSAVSDGKRVARPELKGLTLTFTPASFRHAKRGKTVTEGSFEIDITHAPKTLDLTAKGAKAGAKVLAVYALQGDTLMIATNIAGGGRPTALVPAKGRSVIVYKRQRP